MMRVLRNRLGLGLVLVFALIALGPLLSGSQSGLASADHEQTMGPAQWQALSETVAQNLTRAGIPTPYIPELTREYLWAFQQALMQGATVPQADGLASQRIAAGVQQAVGASTQEPEAGGQTGADVVRRYTLGQEGYRQSNQILDKQFKGWR